MSLQASLLNLMLRFTFKRHSIGRLDALAIRARQARLTRALPLPHGVHHAPVKAEAEHAKGLTGLCGAEWLVPEQPRGTVLYCHGGGYFFCSLLTHRPVAAQLARRSQMRVLSLDYRMAPEHACPAAVDDVVLWWRQLLAQGSLPGDVVFAGDSAGGGLVLAALQTARDQGLPMPAGALLFSPWTDLSCSGESMKTNSRSDVMFHPSAMPQAARFYLQDRHPEDPLASPLFGDLRGLPPLMIHASTTELLWSDSQRLHERALAQGVRSELHSRAGMPHVWPTFVTLPEAKTSLDASAAFMRRVTSRAPDPASPAPIGAPHAA